MGLKREGEKNQNRDIRTKEQTHGLVGCTFKVFIIIGVFVMYML